MDARKQARIDLAAVLRWSAKLELHEGVDNHFSVMVPGEDDRFLINPHRRHWRDIRASDLVEVDAEGNLIEGSEPPEATAFFIHWRIHVKCAHARCILHTHMPYATALTAIEGGRLEPIAQPALKFHNQIAYDDKYNGLALDANEGDRLADALFDKRIAFLANHGIIATGPTVAHAFNDLYYLERAAQAQVLAMSTGQPLQRIPQDVCASTFEQMQSDRDDQATRHLAEIKRILDAQEPDYAE
ncbi:MAG: aldolase [Rhodospirillaceae bacterium]|jgi:ribulose-5-phosphate 4-epimerase/fuculose-1-phosphate aldolase|nr:aldolase [Rhodospirillaceae bacterium]MBT6137551.1 aldolase [Rhodospirillaceae bacterium]